MTARAAAARPRCQRGRARELRRRARRQDARPRGERDRAVRGPRPRELRDAMVAGRPGPRRSSTRSWRRCPVLGVLAVLLVGSRPGRGAARSTPGRPRPGRLPVHAARLPDPRDRLGARRAAAQRRRLGPGRAACSTRPAACRYGEPSAPRAGGPSRRRRRGRRGSPTTTPRSCTTSTSRAARARRSRWSARPGRASPRWRACWSGWSTPTPARSSSTASTCASCGPGGVADAAALVPQQTFLFDDTVRGNVTLGARRRPTRTSGRRCGWRRPTASWPRCRTASTPRSASAARSLSGGQRQRLALARAAGPPAAAARARRRDLAASTRRSSSASWPGCATATAPSTVVVVAYRKATIALADEVVYVEHGRVVDRGTARRAARHAPRATASWSPRTSGSTPTERATARGRGRVRGGRHERAAAASTTLSAAPRSARAPASAPSPRSRRGLRAVAGVPDRACRSRSLLARGRDARSRRRPGRRAAGRSTSGLNAPGGPDLGLRPQIVLWALAAVPSLTAVAGYLMNVRLFRVTEGGLPTLRVRGVPARPRPVGAHPEHRAARLAGLARHQRRRHDQHVHAVGRAHARDQRRPAVDLPPC